MVQILSYDAFLRAVKQNIDLDHVFLLGAGASINSGVQSASDCIWEWKRDILVSQNLAISNQFKNYNSTEIREKIQKWFDNEGCYLPIDHPDEYSTYAELAYPIADVRRKYFKSICADKKPSVGYEILCIIAQIGMVRLVFTTNFDGLIVRAAYQTELTPIEITLDTANRIYKSVSKNELLCVALHGDYKYGRLKNTCEELDTQHKDFSNALAHHLTTKHLIVLGYSGRDKSLMNALNNAYQSMGDGILFWCGYKNDMSHEVEILLKKINKKGREAYFVSTNGFDDTLSDLAKHCYEDNETIQEKLRQTLQITNIDDVVGKDGGDFSVNSIAEGIQSVCNPTNVAIRNTSRVIQVSSLLNASELVIANIVGTWDENSAPDRAIISLLACKEYSDWITKLRNVLQQAESPISLKDGRWRITERKTLWQALGTRLFDNDLDLIKQCAVSVLAERDPQFDLPVEERYLASIHGKVLKHSPELRQGLAESLALLGNKPDDLTNCSQHKSETVATLAVREIFANADWVLWGSLNNLHPVLAEAAPDEFLKIVDNALQQTPCPFDELFSQEGDGFNGGNYLTGLLWALETLAWDEKFFVRACVLFGELASHDLGGNWTNRPANSLTTILLPWLPQTIASINKRKVALKTLQREVPAVAWELLLTLLPNQHQTSSGTHKPSWRNTIPDGWEKGVAQQEYWEQVSFYAELAVSMASHDIAKLNELIDHLGNLPRHSFDKVLEHISSEAITSKPEDERLALWTSLTNFTSKHKRYSDAKWALSSDIISKVEGVAAKIAPTNPLNLHRRLFGDRNFDLYEENDNWEEQQQKLEVHRQQAIKEILDNGGMDAIIQFAEAVKSPSHIGHSLGVIAQSEIDATILPALLETKNKKLAQFANSYVWSRQYSHGWGWVDGLDKSTWSGTQIGQFLSYLPFTEGAWNRATAWLREFEKEYWSRTSTNQYGKDGDIGFAIDKLIEYERPHAAINCLHRMLYNKHPLDKSQSVKALIDAASSAEPSSAMDTHQIGEVIKALQDDPNTDPEDLYRVEWVYLSLLDRDRSTSPKFLETRLASDPAFFCEVMLLIFPLDKEDKSDKKLSEQDKSIATNAFGLLHAWRTPPGMQSDGTFSQEHFTEWLKQTTDMCAESGHLELALMHIGQVLIHCPPDPQGLWIDQTVALELNARDVEEMRNGFSSAIFNSRGVHTIDPTGKPERELAIHYRQKADAIENAGYQRLAVTMRGLAESYDRDADRLIDRHKSEDEE